MGQPVNIDRRGLVAAGLSLVYPGIGHLYLRAWVRALAWFALAFATTAILTPPELLAAFQQQGLSALTTSDIPQDLTLALLVVRALNVMDAYVVAVRQARTSDPDLDPDTTDSDPTDLDKAAGDPESCPNCGRELDDDIDFCPWCTHELDGEE